MKSLKRLGIDPLAVYGTLCVKCPVGDTDDADDDCVARVAEELAIVQPKIVVVMGEEALRILNDLDMPARTPRQRRARGRAVADALDRRPVHARHRRRLGRAGREAGVLVCLPRARRVVRGAAALLTAPILATAYFAIAPALPDLGDGDLPLLVADGIGLIAIAATVWSLLPAWRAQNVLACRAARGGDRHRDPEPRGRRRAGQRARGARGVGGRAPARLRARDARRGARRAAVRGGDRHLVGRERADVAARRRGPRPGRPPELRHPGLGRRQRGRPGADRRDLPGHVRRAGRGGSACAGARRSRA